MIQSLSRRVALTVSGTLLLLAGCGSGSQVTRIQDVPATADAPYQKILAIALFDSFDNRRELERAIATELADRGVEVVPSTSKMDTRTPKTRKTFVSMAQEAGVDAVMVVHLASVDADFKVKTMNPQSTYNVRPTWYYNLWSVELTEYVEPRALEIDNRLVLATELYSVQSRDLVWAIESRFKIVEGIDFLWDRKAFGEQSAVIARNLARDGLIRK
jgi:hypothetical protein